MHAHASQKAKEDASRKAEIASIMTLEEDAADTMMAVAPKVSQRRALFLWSRNRAPTKARVQHTLVQLYTRVSNLISAQPEKPKPKPEPKPEPKDPLAVCDKAEL